MPTAFAVGPGYHLRLAEGGMGFILALSGCVRRIQLSVVERVGISSDFFLSLRPGQFITVGCGVAMSSPQILSFPLPAFLKKGGMIRAEPPWYLVAWKNPFTVRNNFQEKDLCFFSLSSFYCCVSSFCRLAPSVLGSAFVKVCLRRCHCAPSILRGPDGSWILAMPCVVTAWVRPVVESQNSGFSKIRTAPTSGGFLIISKISSFSRFLSLRIPGSLDACGTENLSLSGFRFFISSCSSSGCSLPKVWRMVSIFSLSL